MVVVQDRLAERVRSRGFLADQHLPVSRSLSLHCSVTTALPSTAVQTAMVACDTVALPLSVGMRVNRLSTSLRTAAADAGVATPTALLTSALMTSKRLALRLPAKNTDAVMLRLASRPLPKNASRSDCVARRRAAKCIGQLANAR